MNTYKALLMFTVSSIVFSVAQAQDVMVGSGQLLPTQRITRVTGQSTSTTGTILKKDIRWESKIPLNKTYGELNAEQKAALHGLYQSLPEGDEPPFPAEGMRSIFNPIRNAQRIATSRGELNLVVTVGPDGKATKVESFGSASERMDEFAQEVMMLTRFKPGMCSGQPCIMQFRFTQKLSAG